MVRDDFDEFAELLDAAFDLIGKTPAAKVVSPGSKALFFRALSEYSLQQVRSAIGQHIKRGKFTPTPADIVEHIEAMTNGDGRPGPEEAWALAMSSQDERDTVVWTAETAQAWMTAKPVMESSGPITARKTFVETYTRLVAAARAQRRPVAWSAHLGWDKVGQVQVLKRAVEQGQLPAPQVEALLPPPEVAEMKLSPVAKEQLARVKQLLADSAEQRQAKLEAEFDARNQSEGEFRRDLHRRVRQHQAYLQMADTIQITREEGRRTQRAADRP